MAKKLVVQRNLRKSQRGGAPYLKYLGFSAIGLIFLVVITPYLLRDKSREATKKRTISESGVVTKELPVQARTEPAPEKTNVPAAAAAKPESVSPAIPAGAPAGEEAVNPPRPQSSPETAPKTVTASREPSPPQPQAAPGPVEKGPAAAQQASPKESEDEPPLPPVAPPKETTPGGTSQGSQGVLFPKSGNTSEAPPAVAENPHPKAVKRTGRMAQHKKTASAAKPAKIPKTVRCAKPAVKAKPAVSAKPAAPGPKPVAPAAKDVGSFGVQVGSVFKSMSQAQSVQKRLAARGYKASIRRVGCSGYCVVTSASSRSKAYTLKEQMNAVGLKNTKVVGTVPPAQAGKR